jgi:hypothetical protein
MVTTDYVPVNKDPKVDKTKLIISNVKENVNVQHLDFYIQLITDDKAIESINWSLEYPGKIIINFKREMDIDKIFETFHNNKKFQTINGRPIDLETVNMTKTIVVLINEYRNEEKPWNHVGLNPLDDEEESDKYEPRSIPATRDLLELYFSNKKKSGGGEVEKVDRKNSRYWLVSMVDMRVVKEIAKREHIIDEKPIKVTKTKK